MSKQKKKTTSCNKYWSKKELDILSEYYGEVPNEEICIMLPNRNFTAIQKKASVIGIGGRYDISELSRKYTINLDYFSEVSIDTCYWAGWIASDGCLSVKNGTDKSVQFKISYKDISILRSMRSYVGSDAPITTYRKNGKKYCRIDFHGVGKWHDDLYDGWNIVERKTWHLKPPELSGDLALAFIKGMVDGNGSIYYDKNGYLIFSHCSTYEVTEWIRDELYKYEDKQKYKKQKIGKNGNSDVNYVCRYSHNRTKHICKIIKSIKTPYQLERKWSKID